MEAQIIKSQACEKTNDETLSAASVSFSSLSEFHLRLAHDSPFLVFFLLFFSFFFLFQTQHSSMWGVKEATHPDVNLMLLLPRRLTEEEEEERREATAGWN